VWECTPGGWAIVDRTNTETMMLLGGRVRIHAGRRRRGRARGGRRLRPAQGLERALDVLETVRKLYVTAE